MRESSLQFFPGQSQHPWNSAPQLIPFPQYSGFTINAEKSKFIKSSPSSLHLTCLVISASIPQTFLLKLTYKSLTSTIRRMFNYILFIEVLSTVILWFPLLVQTGEAHPCLGFSTSSTKLDVSGHFLSITPSLAHMIGLGSRLQILIVSFHPNRYINNVSPFVWVWVWFGAAAHPQLPVSFTLTTSRTLEL